MKYLPILLALVIFTQPAAACLNLYGEDIHGGEHYMEHSMFRITSFNEKDIKKKLEALNNKIGYTGNYTYKDVSDYGAYLLMAGKYADGLTVFQALYKDHAEEYTIVQNLGTAYELNGMPDTAFYFIKKGYMLNPASHRGSEWLHIRYLESVTTKKQLDFSKSYFLDTTVFAQKPGYNPVGHNFEADCLLRHVNDQLNERIPFTLGKDDLLAKLLVEHGDLYAEKFSVTRAKICYLYAQYFCSNPDGLKLISQKLERVNAAINSRARDRQASREYDQSYEGYRKIAMRKPLNTKKWVFIPVESLLEKLKAAPSM